MRKIIRLTVRIFACVLALATFAPLQSCTPGEREPLPRVNIAPPALKEQAAPNDKGEVINYSINRTISSCMVVQRNAYFNVFGKADRPGGYIYGEFMGEKRYAKIGKDGSFSIQFSSHEATSEPQTLKVCPKNGEAAEFTDILVGDVWMVSGQSNAELSYLLARQKLPEYDKDISGDDLIRVFSQAAADVLYAIENNGLDATVPGEDVLNEDNCWKKATPENVSPFSAIGYYFGKELSKYTDVPIGLVMSAAGGAAIQELMPGETAEEIGYTAGAMVPVSGYYNTLMHPFTHNKITGMLFYQGESESGGEQFNFYAEHLAKTVEAYREIWGLEFPFINVQLSSHGIEGSSFWPNLPRLRAAQYDASQIIPNSYIVTSMDQGFRKGDPEFAHPLYKFQIGYRAARIAAFVSYGIGEEEHMLTPELESVTFNDDNIIVIKFKNVGDGITLAEGDEIKGLYPYYSYRGKMKCTVEILDAFTVKVTPKEQAYSIGYGLMHDAFQDAANIMSSDGLPMPAFEIKNNKYTGY
ncbi:MAG: sialate O-acetylesterase [Clostridia bacterium]|nr:sialate O-acetylesterase [Clostridia bacterium]